ncbi:hypothetical protein [Nonomuraea sp. NPDC049758]|uniref:hypothetical protein n=1 Tax=Nonomuraea sp. NPDC049758 TaxID=3154360 RepID=UPI0034355B2A
MTDPYLYGGGEAGGVASVTVPYAEQVALMDDLLAEPSPAQWDAPLARHGTVRDLVGRWWPAGGPRTPSRTRRRATGTSPAT